MMGLFLFLCSVFIVALVVAFLYTLFNKWGLWEYLQIHADAWLEKITKKDTDILNRLFSCTFCTTWWLTVLVCLISLTFTGELFFLLVPFCSTPISRFLL